MTVRTFGLLRFLNENNMKVLRIVNERNECVYVERRYCRFFWFRVSPKYRTNIEAYNWVRRCKGVELVTKK